MLEALGGIIDAIGVALSFVVSFFQGFINLFIVIGQSVLFIYTIWPFIPSVILLFGYVGVGLILILHILGR